jgi:acetyl-CoA carboxylase carboxyl transferase subunit beta
MPLFGTPKYTIVKIKKKRDIPEGLWTKCEDCGEIIYNKALEENLKVCPKCDYHFIIGAYERIGILLDKGTFQEHDRGLISLDPLEFKGPKTYKEKLKQDSDQTGLEDAAVSGRGSIGGIDVVIVVTDSRFIMGSMGSVVGEKITRAIDFSIKNSLPLLIISGSGGGARMYEGMFSLMQMAKTSVSLAVHNSSGLPYISILTNPTMAGVLASFASLGDVIMAEPRALIGFTGPRVIESTIREKLPEGFQRSEFLLKHGLLDMIVHRKDMRNTLVNLLGYLKV